MRLAALLQVALVIFLGTPEFWRGLDLRDDRPIKFPARHQFFLRLFRGSLLFGLIIKNDRAILRSNVGSLSIQRRRVVIRPKNIEQFVVANLRRIELDLYDLSVAGFVGAYIFVARILF